MERGRGERGAGGKKHRVERMVRDGKCGRCEKHLWNREEDEDGGRTVDEWMECGRGEGGEQAWISIGRRRDGKGWRRGEKQARRRRKAEG